MIDNDLGLGSYDSEYEAIKTLDRRATVPEGKYEVRVVDVTLDKDQNQNARLTLGLEVQDTEHEGTLLVLDNHFYDSRKLEYTKKALVGLGLGHLRPSDLQHQEVRSAMIGIRASVTCVSKPGKNGGSFFNIYVNRRLPDDSDGGRAEFLAPAGGTSTLSIPAPRPQEDDLPF